jgi:hypothetical protein
MRVQNLLVEYVRVDPKKLEQRLKQEYEWQSLHPETAEDEGLTTPEGLARYLERFDPSPKSKYVNWMLQRYIQGGIVRLEDIGNGVTQALERFEELKNAKKLGADADINKLKSLGDLNALIRKFAEEKIDTRKGRAKDIKVVLDTDKYSILVPETYEASKELACDTDWCTAFPEMYRQYSKQGPLYIITHKPSGNRWQFHFESEQFMDERDEPIEQSNESNVADDYGVAALLEFFDKHKEVGEAFAKLGKFKIEGDSWIFPIEIIERQGAFIPREKEFAKTGYKAYDKYGLLHRDPSKGPAVLIKENDKYHGPSKTEIYYVDGEKHRDGAPAYTRTQGELTIEWWYQDGKAHRDPKDGPAGTTYLDTDTGEINPEHLDTRDPEEALTRYERWYDYSVDGESIGTNKTGGPLPEKKTGLPSEWYKEQEEIAEMMRLAGISPHAKEQRESIQAASATAAEKAQFQTENKVEPGTDEWFRLWFARPDLTGETPFDK